MKNPITVITGNIVGGKHIGRTLGFPTANIEPSAHRGMPENGVYAAVISIEGEEGSLPCVLNQGKHPTLPEGMPTIEAFILDFSGDIYGRAVRVEYLEYLRPEKRFDSLDDLKAQISRDAEAARVICQG